MPYNPYSPRPIPTDIEQQSKDRSVSPPSTKDVTVSEVAPIFDAAENRVPTKDSEPKPRPRGARFPAREPSINMRNWEVSPDRIAFDLGISR